ncbi:hypothetical protein [Candidatus Burkholderia verschuerenii]|uniref:hypothetical protein n=1 Tax=Candidatus Burkholderia verschuerenii TaxID=242163 RepID=UPI00067BDB66|nr:hypothetical protein [Candidatus Burkholderia verschuerenii]
MESVQKVSVVLDLHPEDYRRMREAAENAKMPEGEFCGLALHRGIGMLRDLRRDAPTVATERNGKALEANCEH